MWRFGLGTLLVMSMYGQYTFTSWSDALNEPLPKAKIIQCQPAGEGACVCPPRTARAGDKCRLVQPPPAVQPSEAGLFACTEELRKEAVRRGGLSYLNATFSERDAVTSCNQSCAKRAKGLAHSVCRRNVSSVPAPPESLPPLSDICLAEHLAGVFTQNRKIIESSWRRGIVKASKMKLLVSGLIRDGAKSLPIMIPLIDKLGQYFADYRLVIMENDSVDNTTEILKALQLTYPKMEYQTLVLNTSGDRDGSKNGLMWLRVKRMAHARNLLLKQMGPTMADLQPDIVAMVDLDLGSESAYPFEVDMVLSSIGRKELENGFDLLCANSLRRYGQRHEVGYHDVFALRDENHLTMDDTWTVDFNNPKAIARNLFHQLDLINVRSCFGGLALYNPAAMCGCDYDETLNDCEHVGFHRCMSCRNLNRMFIDPLLATRYESELVIPRLCLSPGESVKEREPPRNARDCLSQGGHDYLRCGGTTYCCNHLACRRSHKVPLMCGNTVVQGCVCRNPRPNVSIV